MAFPSNHNLDAFLAGRRNVILAGSRADGRPHLTPAWYYWDGERFYVSTTRDRVKYAIFRQDPRAQLAVDDPAGLRAVVIPATVEIREDTGAQLSRFQAIRDKYGMSLLSDQEHLESLTADGRVLLVITPDGPPYTLDVLGLPLASAEPWRSPPAEAHGLAPSADPALTPVNARDRMDEHLTRLQAGRPDNLGASRQ